MRVFNPSRLSLARKRRGLTKRRLAERAGVTERILHSYEAGGAEPSDATLEKLADVLVFPLTFFGADDLL